MQTIDNPIEPNQHRWGTSQYVTRNKELWVAFVIGRKGGASSMHSHYFKSNTYVVITGRVRIEADRVRNGSFVKNVELGPGSIFTVPHGELHRMVFLEDSRLYEIYATVPPYAVSLADIERLDEGRDPSYS